MHKLLKKKTCKIRTFQHPVYCELYAVADALFPHCGYKQRLYPSLLINLLLLLLHSITALYLWTLPQHCSCILLICIFNSVSKSVLCFCYKWAASCFSGSNGAPTQKHTQTMVFRNSPGGEVGWIKSILFLRNIF